MIKIEKNEKLTQIKIIHGSMLLNIDCVWRKEFEI